MYIKGLVNIVTKDQINACQRCQRCEISQYKFKGYVITLISESKVNLIHCIHVRDVRDESNYIAFDLLLRYFKSPMSLT